jgi:prephenate dehydrogenase
VERITIIGLGLIGTSLGLALKKSGLKDLEIMGHDREPGNAAAARKRGAVDRTSYSLGGAIENSRMVILATPVMAIKEVLEQIGPNLEPGTLVTDTGSTKAHVLQWANDYLPPEVDFVGGHPMAGKEQSGPEAAEADLFVDAVYAICPAPGASKQAASSVAGLAETIGAKAYFVDPKEHDSYVAAVSHLPFILSTSLVAATTQSAGWREMSRMAAGGYRDISRLAAADPIMHRDICVTNKEGIVHWVDECIKQLYAIRNQIRDDEDALEKTFISTWEARMRWEAGISSEARPGEELPKASDSFMSLMVGDRMAKRMRDLTDKDKPDKTKYRKA